MNQNLKEILDFYTEKYHHPSFIDWDPISIPHQFSLKQDREIIGFWISILSWGQRKSIIQSGNKLIELMDGAPYDFIRNHQEKDRLRFENFKHRTFQYSDSLYFLEFFQQHYSRNKSLEIAFNPEKFSEETTVENHLIYFNEYFFNQGEYLNRTKKHIANPQKNSACKRINMFLRWMVRKDEKGVDFGIWDNIKSHQLVCPLDVHVHRVAEQYQLLPKGVSNWKAALELTKNLKKFDPQDPVKYDFGLFGLGLENYRKFK